MSTQQNTNIEEIKLRQIDVELGDSAGDSVGDSALIRIGYSVGDSTGDSTGVRAENKAPVREGERAGDSKERVFDFFYAPRNCIGLDRSFLDEIKTQLDNYGMSHLELFSEHSEWNWPYIRDKWNKHVDNCRRRGVLIKNMLSWKQDLRKWISDMEMDRRATCFTKAHNMLRSKYNTVDHFGKWFPLKRETPEEESSRIFYERVFICILLVLALLLPISTFL